jgi:hypothetical protein
VLREKWQVQELNNLLKNAYKEGGKFTDQTMSQVYLYATDLAKNGASYNHLFDALGEVLNLMREGKSYDQSVFLVTAQFGFQSIEDERIQMYRFACDMLIVDGNEPNYKLQQAQVDNFIRYFIQECPIGFKERCDWFQHLVEGTASLQSRFEDRVALITTTVALRMQRDIPDEVSTAVILALNDLLTIGVTFDDALQTATQHLVQSKSSLFQAIDKVLKKERVDGAAAAA